MRRRPPSTTRTDTLFPSTSLFRSGTTRSRGGTGGLRRVRTARGRTAQSTRWLERQLNDPYVRRAKADGYRSRAAYKLLELDERFGMLKGVRRVIDLGIAPGGWSQVVRRKHPDAVVVGIDLLPEIGRAHSELQSLMRSSYAVFCLKKKRN